MKLKEVLRKIQPKQIIGEADIDIKGVNIDSRLVKEGDLFIALKGTQVDGHKFIPSAIKSGAIAVLCMDVPAEPAEGVTYIQVDNTENAGGKAATMFFGDPSSRLKLVGVTGTNGKTTIATLLYNMFRKFGYKAGLISTVCNYIDGEAVHTDHTTPDPITLNRELGEMADAGCEYAFMECSSIAIVQERIAGLKFAGGLFTNLTRDHLDYHKTMENYRNAKKKFFDDLPSDAFAITNLDDKNGMYMVQNTKAKVYTYSLTQMADIRCKVIESHFGGMYLDINGKEVGVSFIGRFNASNLCAVYGAALHLGKTPDEILQVLSTLHPVNGRLEAIRSKDGITAIVDYAHTPDAIENVLSAIHGVLQGKGEVITVCGAGGNRDKGKRPLMAQEAVKQSDKVIITSDNPRFEKPEDIINDMLAGLNDEQMKKVITIVDRKEAIRTACMMAKPGDAVLIAGKGHEDYQEIKGVKHHFDDHEVVREIFGITK